MRIQEYNDLVDYQNLLEANAQDALFHAFTIYNTDMAIDILTVAPPEWTHVFQPLQPLFEKAILDLRPYHQLGCVPNYPDLLKAFRFMPPNGVKVVILGQDPYPDKHLASGLAFGIKEASLHHPSSLKNIYDELNRSFQKFQMGFDDTLETWAKQGVLLLNSALTSVEGKPGQHLKIWKPFITQLLQYISYENPNCIFVFMGKHATSFADQLPSHWRFPVPHPAAAAYGKSQGVLGTNVFVQVNNTLKQYGYKEIDWFASPF